jgi:uncharacterized glyoxalase superfamily protein PhnB
VGVQLRLVGLVVEDMGRSLAFYRRLGVRVPDGVEGEPHVEARLPGGMTLFWDTAELVASFDPGREPPSGGRRVVLEFDCGSAEAVDATYADLVAAGHEGRAEPFDSPWGPRYAMVLDPDGNEISLTAPEHWG